MKTISLLAAGLLACSPLAQSQAQQAYPTKPIQMLVPFSAGGAADIVARMIAQRLSERLGQPFIVDNKAGAGGAIATDYALKAPADGYAMLMVSNTFTTLPELNRKFSWKPDVDFRPLYGVGSFPNVIVVHPDVPVRSIASLVLLAKNEPGQLTFASTGTGSSVHLAAELFAGMAGIKLNHVPYKGSAPALNDLIGGHVAMMFSTMASAAGLVRDGNKVRALAVTGATRSSLFPELPTVAEAGLPGYEAVLHYGIVAPAGTPRPVVDKLNAALNKALADGEVKRRLALEGAEALPVSPDEYAKDIAKEESKWSDIIRKSGMKAE